LNIASACVECIINQASRVGETLHVDKTTKERLVWQAKRMSEHFSFSQTPPEVATPVYEALADILHKEDIYEEIKNHSTQKALAFLPLLQRKLEESDDLFMSALKIAVSGNVIDLASEVMFDLQEELSFFVNRIP